MASTEDIEARLAAYVDGELDPTAREEIEKHLAGNPQHRQLIAELMEQRSLLQTLPRELAPADLSDMLSAQLERAVLLGDVDAGVNYSRMRINRWAQMRAIAAVVLLAGGLFAAIYYLLPSPGAHQPELADLRSLPTTRPAGAVPVLDTEGLGLAGGSTMHRDEGLDLRLGKGGVPHAPSEQERRAKGALASGPAISLPDGIASNSMDPGERMFRETVLQQLQSSANRVGGEADKSVVMVINTDNPAETNRRIAGYLAQTRLNWEPYNQPMPGPLNLGQQQVVSATRLRDEQMQLKVAAPASTMPATPDATEPLNISSGQSPQVQQMAQQAEAPMAASVDRAHADFALGGRTLGYGEGIGGQVYVARGVPRRQVNDIRRDLDSLSPTPTAAPATTLPTEAKLESSELAAATPATPATPATMPAAERQIMARPSAVEERSRELRVGDLLTIQTPGLVGPGAQPRTQQRIEPGGTITLYMLEPFSCLGMTPEVLARTIADKYRQINISAGDQVTVDVTEPSTQPAAPGSENGAENPATQPAGDLVDVVILVQQSSAPTTQSAEVAPAAQVQAPAATTEPAP